MPPLLCRLWLESSWRSCFIVYASTLSAVKRRLASDLQFVQRRNSLTGQMEWDTEESEYDYSREIARSSYADMLHDTERNKKYYQAIKLAVKEIHEQGKKAKVLDIGTGTGLLSMMAATAGAEQITAIEMFAPMARVARRITKANGFDFIKVINKHSADVELGKDMEEKANILVTELFDTELIGEGALVAYHHAHQNLMEEGSLAVPHSASTYMQLVESKMMYSWHALNRIKVTQSDGSEAIIEPAPSMATCSGVPAVHDIQLSQVRRDQFKEITDPVKVFDFDWSSKSLSPNPRREIVNAKALLTGTVQVVLSWWTLDMHKNSDIILSTAPYWHHPTPKNMQWRDHWIQSVYFMPQVLKVEKGDDITISASHDSYSMWFDATLDPTVATKAEVKHPVCTYLPRMLWSRPRLAMLNNEHRNSAIADVLRTIDFSPKDHTTVCVSDVSLLPLFVACFSNHNIYALECGPLAQQAIQDLVRHNRMSDRITVIDTGTDNQADKALPITKGTVDLLIGEPFFDCSSIPWVDLKFWYERSRLNDYLSTNARIHPVGGRLCVAAIEFEDLWKIRAPVRVVEGFDVSVMDDMISEAMETEDYHEPEPHALWEYPNTLLTDPKQVLEFDFTKPVPQEEISTSGCLELNMTGTCHGVALWMEYDLDANTTLSTGLAKASGSCGVWNMHYKQGVFFLRKPVHIEKSKPNIQYEISFIPQTGDVKMKFKPDNDHCEVSDQS